MFADLHEKHDGKTKTEKRKRFEHISFSINFKRLYTQIFVYTHFEKQNMRSSMRKDFLNGSAKISKRKNRQKTTLEKNLNVYLKSCNLSCNVYLKRSSKYHREIAHRFSCVSPYINIQLNYVNQLANPYIYWLSKAGEDKLTQFVQETLFIYVYRKTKFISPETISIRRGGEAPET